MPVFYPTYRTGTSQDLMTVISRAAALRAEKTGLKLPDKNTRNRIWMEPSLNLAGLLLWRLVECLPARWVFKGHEVFFKVLASPLACPYDDGPKLVAARELARRVHKESGVRPALVALISHGPMVGELANMNFELVRHAMWALSALRDGRGRPRLLVAVDAFALDTFSLPVEAVYAGFMGNYHLGFDRLTLGRSKMSRRLLRRTAWYHTPFRLGRFLRDGGEMGMALGGGVPTTSRVLYAVKEWIGDRIKASPMRSKPAEVIEKLEQYPGFRRVLEESSLAGIPSVWRRMEAWVIAAMAWPGASGAIPAETGKLEERSLGILTHCLEALGFSPPKIAQALDEFAEELSRETPWRARFFRLLAGRVLKAGRPLVFVPIVHRSSGAAIDVGTAWAWTGLEGGRVLARSAEGADWEGSVQGFAKQFVSRNYW